VLLATGNTLNPSVLKRCQSLPPGFQSFARKYTLPVYHVKTGLVAVKCGHRPRSYAKTNHHRNHREPTDCEAWPTLTVFFLSGWDKTEATLLVHFNPSKSQEPPFEDVNPPDSWVAHTNA